MSTASSSSDSGRSGTEQIDASSVSSSIPPSDDPVVIVGLACRVPGATNPSQLWDNIVAQKDLQRKMPADRFNVDAFYHPDGKNKGTTNAKYGYFLDQSLADFDAGFFGISGKEAEAIDPQQRLLLEVVYEALENAGITLDEINGSQTSVYCGSFTGDYDAMTTKDLATYPMYTAIGNGKAILSNRISYFYNLHGPSVTMDTACSSSLVCFHLGSQSILNREADISIVVGSALHFDPNVYITMTDLGMLSTDGRCRAFDASGSGYVRGEGIAAAIMMRKSNAIRHNNDIRAVVKITRVNHDGKTQGITLPSSEAQEALIRQAYEESGLDPVDTGYFEAHGTGTQAGDPRETRAIGAVFAKGRDEPLYVGSVKTNIGHLEGASGLAGIIKTTLALEHAQIPPNMHFKVGNPGIKFKEWNIQVPQVLTEWKPINGVRRADINSFGYGGTNAHVILEGYYPSEEGKAVPEKLPTSLATMTKGRPYLLPMTSHTPKAGKLMAAKLATYIESNATVNVADVAHSLSYRRSMHPQRSFAIGGNQLEILQDLANPKPAANWTKASTTKPRLGFVFTGQGAQWFAMGRQLLLQSPLFLQTMKRCDAALAVLPDAPKWSFITELSKSKTETRLEHAEFSQPLCTALQLGILVLLERWGIKPHAVVGHSSGEVAAAYAAGILTLENAIIASYYRGLYMSNAPEGVASVPGAMMAVGLTEPEAIAEIAAYDDKIKIAAINSPSSITLSGDKDAIVALGAALTERKVFARQLQVLQAFHSHHMYPLAPGLEKALNKCSTFIPQPATCRMFSTVTSRVADPTKMGGIYWATNMVQSVRFSDGLTGIVFDDLDQQNVDILVEIGPHAVLKGPSNQILKSLKLEIPYVASLTRGTPDFECLLTCAGQLFSLGYPVDLVAVNQDHFVNDLGVVSKATPGKKLATLPTYAWDHQRYWAETRYIKEHRQRKHRHSLLGAPVPGSTPTNPRWRNYIRQSELPWLSDHVVDGKVIFPAAAYVSCAIEAAARLGGEPENIKSIHLKDIVVKAALVLSDTEAGNEIGLELRPVTESAKTHSETWHEFILSSFDDTGRCTEHGHGLINIERGAAEAVKTNSVYRTHDQLTKQTYRSVAREPMYKHLWDLGLMYSEAFRLVSGNVESGPGFAMAPLNFSTDRYEKNSETDTILHATLLDASFHVIFAALEDKLGRTLTEPFIPTFIKTIKVAGDFVGADKEFQKNLNVCSFTELPSPRVAISDVIVRKNGSDDLALLIQGLEVKSLGKDANEGQSKRSLFFRPRWAPSFQLLGLSQNLPTQNLNTLIDEYSHQYPNASVCYIGADVSGAKELVKVLGLTGTDRRRCASLNLYSYTNAGTADEMLKGARAGLVEFSEPKDQYDLVVVNEQCPTSIKDLVKETGYVIYQACQPEEGMFETFKAQDFSVCRPSEESPSAAETVVIAPARPSSFTSGVISTLKASAKGKVTQVRLSSLKTQVPAAENIVLLATLDEDVDTEAAFEPLKALLIALGKNIVWVTKGANMESTDPKQAMCTGFARVARSENDSLRLVTMDVDMKASPKTTAACIYKVLDRSFDEEELTERNGCLYLPRVYAADELNSKLPNGVNSEPKLEPLGSDRALALKIDKVGLVDTLYYGEDEEALLPLADDEIEIETKASAINFRDIAASMGIIDDFKLGDEAAGVVVRLGSKVDSFSIGDRVVAWRPGQGAHKTLCRNPASLSLKVPDNMSFTDAAAFPCILTTAYYSLIDTARLQKGETVLIHAAAGGVGQMAIQVAQSVGAEVIATVGSQAKRDLLKTQFGIPDDHIFNSRDDSFVEGIMKLTKGKGVDVALNSLAGKLLHATWSCITYFGRFIEIGKKDIHENSKIGMDPFRKSVTFASVDLITMFEQSKPLGARIFKECWAMVEDGKIKPPEAVTVVSYADVVKGFRLLQMGKATGKVVLVPHKDDQVMVLPRAYKNTKLFDESKVYLLIGGLGGLGRVMAEWMLRKGAKQIAFLSRSGADRPEAEATVKWLEERGADVNVYRGDVSKYVDVKKCVDAIGTKLAGIFQAAMVLQDCLLNDMTWKQWQYCVQPKVQGTWNLHEATLGQALDFFVCFSSVAAVVGSKAQANYAAANCYMDSLMRTRRQQGLVGTTMNVGAVAGVGVVAENAALQKIMERTGIDFITQEEVLYLLEEAIQSKDTEAQTEAGYDMHQIATGIPLVRADVYWAAKSFVKNLYQNHDFSASTQSTGAVSLTVMLKEAASVEDRKPIILQAFIQKIASVLSVDVETIAPSNSLSTYGLDSIVAVEFRKWFRQAIDVDMPIFNILGSPSINALVAKAAEMFVVAAEATKTTAKAAETTTESKSTESQDTTEKQTGAVIGKADMTQAIPMSTYQSRIWYLHNFLYDKSALNLAIIGQIKGTPSMDILQRTCDEMLRQNASLRTSFYEGDDFPEQKPLDDFSFDLIHKDFSKSESPKEAVNEYLAEMKKTEFNIEDGQSCCGMLAKLAEDEHVLVLIIHHVAIDRGSTAPLMGRMVEMYDALRNEIDPTTLAGPKISYADFTVWHNAVLESEEMQQHNNFWRDNLLGAPPSMKLLPFAKCDRPTYNNPERNVVTSNLGDKLLGRMKRIAAQSNATVFHFLAAAFRAYIWRYTEDDDLTFLMIDGNRPHPDIEDVTGFFVNMVPIRCHEDVDTTFDKLLKSMSDRVLSAMSHNSLPFDNIVQVAKVPKTMSHFPIGQVAINYQMHGAIPKYTTEDFVIEDIRADDIPSACDLNFETVENAENGLDFRLEYSTTLYGDNDMDRFMENFVDFLVSAVKDHRQPITEISMCGPKERSLLSQKFWNVDLVQNNWDNKPVIEMILEKAERNPSAVAIITSDGDDITYADLVSKAYKIGHYLRQAGVQPGDRVGILSRPGIEAVATMVATLLNRCGYVALDADFPPERLAFMVSDSGARIVLVGQGLSQTSSDVESMLTQKTLMTEIEEAASTDSNETWWPTTSPGEPFYLIYTSGSTGKPKGVVLTQSNTQAMLSTLHKDYEFTEQDKFLQQSSMSFDLSIVQIFSALTAGGTVCIACANIRKDPAALADFMQRENVSVTYFTPTQFALLLEFNVQALMACDSYRVAYFAGERLPVRVAQAFYDLATPATLYNTWSPSELVVQTTIHKTARPNDEDTSIPIGFPMANCRHYICDARLNPLPVGFIGEICVGGAQVGAGYLNRPEVNATSFVKNPFCSREDRQLGWTRLFRTGDRGRFAPNGELEFHGRIAGDKQIKLRGFRIDLGEVEQRLFRESVTEDDQKLVDVSVIARTTEEDSSSLVDSRQLIAYIVPRKPMTKSEGQKYVTLLHARIGKHLNAYMLPNGYQILEKLPTTIGGKADRQNLLTRKLELTLPGAHQPAENGAAVQADGETSGGDKLEREILQLFRDVLPSKPTVSMNDNFFNLGGSSILLLRLQAKLKKAYKIALPLQQMLKDPSPAALIESIRQKQGGGKTAEKATTANRTVSWKKELALPESIQYTTERAKVNRSKISNVLITGAGSYIGSHVLATFLAKHPAATAHVLGSTEKLTTDKLVETFRKYQLFDSTVSEAALVARVHCISGTLLKPHFGLDASEFETLGHTVQAIYHLGGDISLLQGYTELRQANVASALDVLELATLNPDFKTEVHHLSTWSVPHLQSWKDSKFTSKAASINIAETAADNFYPAEDDTFGYFKTRWAAEMLMTRAASQREMPISIFRAVAVSASTKTNVPEPADGFVGNMFMEMIRKGRVPDVSMKTPSFALDFVPVDYLADVLCAISSSDAAQVEDGEASIYHVGNETPLTLEQLPTIIGRIRGDSEDGEEQVATTIPLAKWLEDASAGLSAQEQIKWAVFEEYLAKGHNMFALERGNTDDALRRACEEEKAVVVPCPPVDDVYLGAMWRRQGGA